MFLRITYILIAGAIVHSASSLAYADLMVFNDENLFLAASGLTTSDRDSFEDLGTATDLKSITRPTFTMNLVEPALSDFEIQVGGAGTGNVRVAFHSNVEHGRFVFDFNSPVTAFGTYLIDAPEDSDSTGNFDLMFFNDIGDSLVALTGPVTSESSVFFGVIETNGTAMQQVGFELPGASDGFAIDPVYANVAVPEPSSALLCGIGLIGILLRNRARKNT